MTFKILKLAEGYTLVEHYGKEFEEIVTRRTLKGLYTYLRLNGFNLDDINGR